MNTIQSESRNSRRKEAVQRRPRLVAGIAVASLSALMAMTLGVTIVYGQATVYGKATVAPLPIPGGDVIPCPCTGQASGSLLIHSFAPGPGFDGQDAEPNGITNFNGKFAQVYMGGHAVDSAGHAWDVDVDTRVYQGEYVGANGMHDHGTFVLI
jgi:hypothetical protein